MAVYEYSGADAAGNRRSGYVEAESPKAARQALAADGVVAEDVSAPALDGVADFAWRIRFYENLGMLLKGGFPMARALRFLADDAQGRSRGAILAVADAILAGQSLEGAVATVAPALPPFERAALDVAEKTGAQGEMLVRLSSFMEADRRVRENVRSALAYPGAILCFALLLLGVVAFVILPRAAALFPAGAVPASVRALRLAAPVATGAILLLALAGWRFAATLSRRARDGGKAAIRRERLLLSLPVARRLLPQLWASRYAATMSLLLDAGLSPQDAIVASGEATGSALVASLARDAEKAVRGGEPLSRAISGVVPIAPALSAWMAVGEKTGALAEMLSGAADRSRAEYERRLKHFLSLLEPALVAAVGAAVLAVALAVLRPMLDLTTGGA